MFHSQNSNNKIYLLNERALRMIYNDQISSFQDFLMKIIPLLFTILISSHLPLKVISYIAATLIDDLFTTYHIIDDLLTTYHSYNLRSKSKFVASSVYSS